MCYYKCRQWPESSGLEGVADFLVGSIANRLVTPSPAKLFSAWQRCQPWQHCQWFSPIFLLPFLTELSSFKEIFLNILESGQCCRSKSSGQSWQHCQWKVHNVVHKKCATPPRPDDLGHWLKIVRYMQIMRVWTFNLVFSDRGLIYQKWVRPTPL